MATCPVCGKEFELTAHNKIYCCKRCANKRKCERQKVKKRRRKNVTSLNEWLREACACGMSYGKYRSAVEYFGKTFEELKANYESNRIEN